LGAFGPISNYNDAEVVATLKTQLNDNLVHEVWCKQPGGQLARSAFYILKPDDPPLEPEPNLKKTRTFILRKAAWEALRRMGVEVDSPEFQTK
jgi:hypothetical protein